jgi:anti-sigma factor RsiW
MTGADDLTCRELVELVSAYLDDRLSARERERFDMHLVWCEGCVDYLEQLRQTVALMPRVAERDLAPEFRDQLLSAFRDWHGARA